MDESVPNMSRPDEFNNILLLFRAIMDNMADSIYFKDRQCRIMWASQRLADSLERRDPEELVGLTDVEMFGKEFGERTRQEEMRVMETGKPMVGVVECFNREDGTKNWTSTTKHPLRNEKGEVFGLFGITREINEIKQVESDLQFLATHDVLTSLPNRYLLFDRLDQAIYRAQRNGTLVAILFIDLDGFKEINDIHGHAVGDLLLVKVSDQLKTHIRDLDTVARFGGDEFVIILEQIQHEEEARQITARIVEDISHKVDKEKVVPHITVSVGISLFPVHATETSRLMQCADKAMYSAKLRKNTFQLYDPSMEGSSLKE